MLLFYKCLTQNSLLNSHELLSMRVEDSTFFLVKPLQRSLCNTPIRGLSTIFKKDPGGLVYPTNFWYTREILVGIEDWKLKNTDFSR